MANYSYAENRVSFLKIVVGAIISVIVSMILILIFALAIKLFGLSDTCITPVNITIKIISLFFGIFFTLKNKEKGVFYGSIIGILYIIICYLVFSLLIKSFSISLSNLWDLLFGIVAGGIIGIIAVNVKK